jgi:hypothetical protein
MPAERLPAPRTPDRIIDMAVNKPVGDNARKGAAKKRSQVKTKLGGATAWTKRNKKGGEFMAVKKPTTQDSRCTSRSARERAGRARRTSSASHSRQHPHRCPGRARPAPKKSCSSPGCRDCGRSQRGRHRHDTAPITVHKDSSQQHALFGKAAFTGRTNCRCLPFFNHIHSHPPCAARTE